MIENMVCTVLKPLCLWDVPTIHINVCVCVLVLVDYKDISPVYIPALQGHLGLRGHRTCPRNSSNVDSSV